MKFRLPADRISAAVHAAGKPLGKAPGQTYRERVNYIERLRYEERRCRR